jgi:hypothetical protein
MNNLNDGRIFFSGFVLGAFTFILLLHMTKPEAQQPDAPKSNFEVVDTYKGCDVVQYTPDYSARYTYFLDCRK